MFDARDAQRRLIAAHKLLLGPATSREKFSAIRTLVQGINPRIDEALERCENALSKIDKVEQGEFVELSAEHLPERTEDEKRHKAALLLLIRSWKQLQGEIERVQMELNDPHQVQSSGAHVSRWGRILRGAKGPLGLVTVIAVGVVTLQQIAIAITIENHGCGTMYISGSVPLSLPGLSLPKDPIPSGGSAVAELPGLTVNVDGTSPGALILRVLTFSMTFQLSGVDDVTLDGTSLLGKKTEIHLSEQDTHTLRLVCS